MEFDLQLTGLRRHHPATASNGSATCSGTATVATALGGAQANALQLRNIMIEELN